MHIPNVNLDALTDPAARQVGEQLLNLIEMLVAENQTLRSGNQLLRDELARLKGGSGKPTIKPSPASAPPSDHSSERERHTPKPLHKGRKLGMLLPTRTVPCVVDPAVLPPDAIRSDTTTVIVQDLIVQPDIIAFVRDVWFVPSTNTTITAPLPAGY